MNAFGNCCSSGCDTDFPVGCQRGQVWTVSPSLAKLVLVLLLYSLGNLIMLRLIRDWPRLGD